MRHTVFEYIEVDYNRVRFKSCRGKALMLARADRVERSFAHCLDRGGMCHSFLRNSAKYAARIDRLLFNRLRTSIIGLPCDCSQLLDLILIDRLPIIIQKRLFNELIAAWIRFFD